MPEARLRRPPGRPRRLTLDAIVDAACEIGVADLEMSLVADRLETGVATLYGYVKSRAQLLEMVGRRIAFRSLLEDRGQSWQDVLREHAATSANLFRHIPQLITQLMMGGLDTEAVDYAHHILRRLEASGLDRAVATNAYIEVNQVVIGAAVSLMQRRAMAAGGDACPADIPAAFGDYRPTMERIIADYERIAAQTTR